MTLLAVLPIRRSAPVAALLALLAWPAAAQVTTLTHTEDAAPIPRGMLRLRLTTGWTRYDQRFGTDGLTSLGDELSADPLGSAQFEKLVPVEAAIRGLANDGALKLSLGRLVTKGDARIVTTPIALEYGVTRRLSIGVVIPVVQTRRVVTVDVNSRTGTPANVGFLASTAARSAAASANAASAQQFSKAAAKLGQQISACQAAPATAGCGPINADPAGAAAAKARALQLAAAATALGITAPEALVAPRANGVFAVEIELQRNALNRQLQQYLTVSDTGRSVYFAGTDFSYIDFQGHNGVPGLLQSEIGGGLDSIRTTERIGFGDISIGAQLMVFDRFQRDTLPLRRMQSRLAIGAAVRLATSRADTATNLVDIGTGEGAAVELRSAYDVIVGRLGGTVAARYVKSFAREVSAPILGDPEAAFPAPFLGRRTRTAGDVVGLDLTPRYLLTESFALDAHYGFEHTGATTWGTPTTELPAACATSLTCTTPAGTARTAQRVGLGLRYSTVDAWTRGRSPLPLEASYTHLTTISGDAGLPRLSREQIQVRLFTRILGQ